MTDLAVPAHIASALRHKPWCTRPELKAWRTNPQSAVQLGCTCGVSRPMFGDWGDRVAEAAGIPTQAELDATQATLDDTQARPSWYCRDHGAPVDWRGRGCRACAHERAERARARERARAERTQSRAARAEAIRAGGR